MGIIAWIVLGLIAGALAKLIMPGRDPGGIIVTMLIGIAGALIGGGVVSPFRRQWRHRPESRLDHRCRRRRADPAGALPHDCGPPANLLIRTQPDNRRA